MIFNPFPYTSVKRKMMREIWLDEDRREGTSRESSGGKMEDLDLSR